MGYTWWYYYEIQTTINQISDSQNKVRIRVRNAKQLIKKGRFIACKIYIVTNVCLIYSTTLYHRFIYEKLFYALHELLMVEMRHRK